MNQEKRLCDELLGPEVTITANHLDGAGNKHKAGTKAHLYLGDTFGLQSQNEGALVYNQQLPFEITQTDYFTINKDQESIN